MARHRLRHRQSQNNRCRRNKRNNNRRRRNRRRRNRRRRNRRRRIRSRSRLRLRLPTRSKIFPFGNAELNDGFTFSDTLPAAFLHPSLKKLSVGDAKISTFYLNQV